MTIHEELKNLEQATYTDLDSKRLTIDSFLATKIEELIDIKKYCSNCMAYPGQTEWISREDCICDCHRR